MSKLYVIATPIGNLKDITIRSLEILKRVDYIICEDTRRTKILLDHYEIKNKKLISYFSPQEEKRLPSIIKILKKNEAALVVDSGMPAISDPGYLLIKECIKRNIKLEVLPGPSAFLTSLVGSGLPTDKFLFLGFLPKKGTKNYLRKYKNIEVTLIIYESPKRLIKTLKILKEVFKNGMVVIAKELSKIYEEYIRFNIKEIENINLKIKGEITVIFRKDMDILK
jgi:16S rRNA (cytidine1402-2'-O)-methyltransferase